MVTIENWKLPLYAFKHVGGSRINRIPKQQKLTLIEF
jgi:hypothetical protein